VDTATLVDDDGAEARGVAVDDGAEARGVAAHDRGVGTTDRELLLLLATRGAPVGVHRAVWSRGGILRICAGPSHSVLAIGRA
jgi:hypothetical protein